jgi:hypothetical protein
MMMGPKLFTYLFFRNHLMPPPSLIVVNNIIYVFCEKLNQP